MSSAVLLFAFAFVGFIAYAIVSAVLQVSVKIGRLKMQLEWLKKLGPYGD